MKEQTWDPSEGLEAWRRVGLAATLVILLSVPVYMLRRPAETPRTAPPAEALFVGSERCAECHAREHQAWKASNHAHAMLPARPDSVLGNFEGAEFSNRGKRWRFSRREGRYFAWTDDLAGEPREFEVLYTFGWYPLQQYMVAFPGGRLQCLSVAWDASKKRWFDLYPTQDVPPTDWLHWTRAAMNWNTMCSQCHSTGVRKRYDPETDSFRTTWAEISVGCEACHGPGSRHLEWARKPAMGRPQVPNAALEVKTAAMNQKELVNLCAACHSRRAEMRDLDRPGTELLDSHLPTLLAEGLFFPDGQILDEDYEYHAFLQSKMHEKGVKCSDCHDVHRARVRLEGKQVCLQCHRADTYDTPSHHFHKKVYQGKPSSGADCVSCHMPGRNYMVVHFRRDHSLRIPRPDLTAALGVPNACSQAGCHGDKPLAWVQQKYDGWYGKKRKPHYGTVLAAAREARPGARKDLQALAVDRLRPDLVRATAMGLLSGYPGPDSAEVLRQGLADPDPLVRRTAVSQYRAEDPAALAKALAPLLKDPVLAVRAEAANRLAGLPPGTLSEAQQKSFEASLADYRAFLDFSADMPSGRYNRAILEDRLGRREEAEKQYRKALEMDDQFHPAAVNLAVLLAGQGRLDEAEALLRQAHSGRPGDASISFNLGLLLAEQGKTTEAAAALREALESDPDLAPAAYNLAVLVGEKDPAEAAVLCRRALAGRPEDGRYAFTLAYYQSRSGDAGGARKTLESLLEAEPGNVDGIMLLGELYEKGGLRDRARDLYAGALADQDLPAEARNAIATRYAALEAARR